LEVTCMPGPKWPGAKQRGFYEFFSSKKIRMERGGGGAQR
jgi:hypothetical protein